MRNIKCYSKKLLVVCLVLAMILGMLLTGCKKDKPEESTAQETTVNEPDSSADTDNTTKQGDLNEESEKLYQDFLDGKVAMHTQIENNEELLFEDLLLHSVENYDYGQEPPKVTEVSYSMIDCGSDGAEELAIQVTLDADGSYVTEQYVIKDIDKELRLCYSGATMNWMVSSLFANGMVTDSTSFGMSTYVNEYSYIDKDGKLNYIYGETVSYKAYNAFDDRFDADVISKDERLLDAFLKVYNLEPASDYEDTAEWNKSLMYCAEKDDDEPSNGVNFDENLKVMQEIFDRFGVPLYSLNEIKEKIEQKKSDLGLGDTLAWPEIEWNKLSVDTDAVNEAYVSKNGGTSSVGEIFESEDDLKEFLTEGTWLYFEPGTDVDNGDSSLSIVFDKNGTFHGVKSPENTNLMYSFEGEWNLDRLLRSEDQVPDYISMKLTSCDDPAFENFGAFGGYAVEDFGILNGSYVMALQREGEDEIMFTGVANPVLYKTGVELAKAPEYTFEKNLIHDVNLWRVESGEESTFYVSPASRAGISEIMPVAKLSGRSDSNSEHSFAAFEDNGIYHVSVALNENGYVDNIYPRAEEMDSCVAQKPVINNPSEVIRSYFVRKYDFSVESPEGGIVRAYFEKPFIGGYGNVIEKLNKDVDELYGMYKADIDSDNFRQMCESALEMYPSDEFLYNPFKLNGIFTNDKYVSIDFWWEWYMGGVYNSGCACINRDLNTGEKVTLDQLMGISMDEVKERIIASFNDEYGVTIGYSGESISGTIKDMDDFTFHFDNSQIFVEFESYALNLGPSSFTVTLEY